MSKSGKDLVNIFYKHLNFSLINIKTTINLKINLFDECF